jgi:uncharacterized protein (TIGR00290 family)
MTRPAAKSNEPKEKVVLSWSGGKDSAMALYELLREGRYEVVGLLTSVAEGYDRVSHHGVRTELLRQQADAIGLPLEVIYLPVGDNRPCTNEAYEQIMEAVMLRYRDQGVTAVAFGDIFLEDLRAYRERNLARVGMHGVFPIWKRDTTELIHSFVELGFAARVCAVEGKLGPAFVGRLLDREFVAALPAGIDPCGEFGEFHSFVFDGPVFRRPVPVRLGQTVLRDTRHYVDLLPDDASGAADHSDRGPNASASNDSHQPSIPPV